MTATHDDNATTWHDLADPAWRATGAGCPHGDRLTATDRQADWHQSSRLLTGCERMVLYLCNLASPAGRAR